MDGRVGRTRTGGQNRPAWPAGGFHRLRPFAQYRFLAFLPGHLIMVVLHGWTNWRLMLSGWKWDPEYLR